ncbi:sensor histidine kinase [Pseudofrankia saprophytica]|uniref:sensor histidine kinase n=1 Tax=Pseudofrankia saprophytica TaxID=298655 RepID=UPI0006881484|nr:ATP-binding protein [Pseudofrankia saprophytica]
MTDRLDLAEGSATGADRVHQDHIGVVALNSETDYAARGWLETVPDPAVAVRADGKIAAVNARAAALLGYAHDDLIGQPVDAIVSDGLAAVGLRRDAAEPGDPARLEDLGRVTGAVAHDVNNLLSVIRNYAVFVGDALDAAAEADRTARDAGGPVDWEALRHDVAQIQHAGERAAELTAQLLAVVRRKPAELGAVDLCAVVRETVGMLRRPLGERIDVRVELDDDLWLVSADRARLEQAIINLAMNARDAMPQGGTLTVTAGNVVLGGPPEAAPSSPSSQASAASVASWAPAGGAEPAGDQEVGADLPGRRFVSLWVTDTGTGMTPATRARAFEPFFTTKPEDSGTGLGLAVVHDVVTQAGGEAQISSAVGLGTTVSLLLPACDPPGPRGPAVTRATAGEPARLEETAWSATPLASPPGDSAAPDALWICHRRLDGAPSRSAGARRSRVQSPAPSTVSRGAGARP